MGVDLSLRWLLPRADNAEADYYSKVALHNQRSWHAIDIANKEHITMHFDGAACFATRCSACAWCDGHQSSALYLRGLTADAAALRELCRMVLIANAQRAAELRPRHRAKNACN